MNDLISRQAAIDALMPIYKSASLRNRNVFSTARKCMAAIEDLPSAQPKRMPGKWKKISPASIYECSVCGQNIMTQDIDAYRYCHGCGADMRGEQDE